MSANDGDGITRAPFVTDREGEDRRSVSSQVVLAAGLKRRMPGVSLADKFEARGLEALGSGGDGVISYDQVLVLR